MKTFKYILLSLMLTGICALSATAQDSKTIREAGELMARGDLKGAIAVLDKAIEKRRDLFESYRMRANLQMFGGNVAGAVADLDKALEIKSEAAVYAERASLKTFLGDSEGALKDYDYAIANGYKNEKAFVGRAFLKRNTGDLDGAIADYRIAVGMNSDFVQGYVGLAGTLDQKGETDQGILILQNYLDRYEQQRDGNLPKSKAEPIGQSVVLKNEKSEKDKTQIYLQGRNYKTEFKGNTKEEAEKQVSKQEKIFNVAGAYANLAQMLETKGEYDQALTSVDKSLFINKNNFYPTGLRGRILLSKGDLEGALADLNSAISQMPTMPMFYADRGIAFILLGKDAEAQKDFNKSLQLAPKSVDTLNKRIEKAKQKRTEQ